MKRTAFTLIEMMISISILSVMMIFLFQTYSSLNKSNSFYKEKAQLIQTQQLKKRVVYMDFSLALYKSVQILKQDKKEDIVFLQSSNSLHARFNPYIAYILKDEKLYRLESLAPFKEYPLSVDSEFIVDAFGDVKSFRVYENTKGVENNASKSYLVHIDFKQENDILLKIKALNEY